MTQLLSDKMTFLNYDAYSFIRQTQEDPFVISNPVTPALQAFPRVTNTYGSYQVTNI